MECQYEATPQLHHSFEAKVIPCGESIDIPFTFYPREARRYQELVNFEINGLSKQTVEFVGNGCEMKVPDLLRSQKYHQKMNKKQTNVSLLHNKLFLILEGKFKRKFINKLSEL